MSTEPNHTRFRSTQGCSGLICSAVNHEAAYVYQSVHMYMHEMYEATSLIFYINMNFCIEKQSVCSERVASEAVTCSKGFLRLRRSPGVAGRGVVQK